MDGSVTEFNHLRFIPSSWPAESTRTRWFAIVLQSTRGGVARSVERKTKAQILVRLFEDFAFAVRCSTELLRRGGGGSVEVEEASNVSMKGPDSGAGGTGAHVSGAASMPGHVFSSSSEGAGAVS